MDTISIIVPVYKAEKYLCRCVDSLLSQTYRYIEVILVDDGSPDGSGGICEEYAKKDARVRAVHKSNGGVSSARNAGLTVAQGEYIQFVDSDDFVENTMCESLLQSIKRNGSDLVICGYKALKNGREELVAPSGTSTCDLKSLGGHFDDLYSRWLLNSPWNKLYKKSLLIARFNESVSLGEDLLFNLEYLQGARKITLLNSCLYDYNLDNLNSLTSLSRDDFYELARAQYRRITDFCAANFGSAMQIPSAHFIFFSDTVSGIRNMVYLSRHPDSVRRTIREICSDDVFREALRQVEPSGIQHRFVRKCLLSKRVRPIILFFRMKKVLKPN